MIRLPKEPNVPDEVDPQPLAPARPSGWLNRLPGYERSAPGLEWALWKKLPLLLAIGTLLPLAVALLWWMAADTVPTPAQDRDFWLVMYRLIAVVALHWTFVATVAIGCVIVMVMKGPAFVADPYPPVGRDDPP
jgi:hypothetical protein